MIVVGYYIGTMAAKALGVDGTCKPSLLVVGLGGELAGA